MAASSFFQESRNQSRLKSIIVTKYFAAWARIIIGSIKKQSRSRSDRRIAYIDLFCGPGRYSDGTDSTPLQVLKMACQDPDLREHLVTIFNDKSSEHADSLQNAIDAVPDISILRYPPRVVNIEVGDSIASVFEKTRFVPTLFFVDPWGYKGLSLRLVDSIIKDWGSDCIFFFNYNRINMGLTNQAVKDHMDALFGATRATTLREQLDPLRPDQREVAIVEELCRALKDLGSKYVLPFRFKDDLGSRTSHHLIFVSKHFRGYEIMKDIMAKGSSESEQGVSNFEYNPATSLSAFRQPLLFQFSRPLDDLEEMILERFAGRTLTMDGIYKSHSVDTPYIKRNYKQALIILEKAGKLKASPHRAGTFGDGVIVTFFDR